MVTWIACSVPQGSVAGPLLFIAYTEDLEDTISSFTLNHHMYADDTQLLAHMSLKDVSILDRYWRDASLLSKTGAHPDVCS